ncbi:hypothetical protein EPYR_01374 [Erwinia pyrifoliae DSM 12163]|nr:hypothetical protein EPYR_01374 [Erwinia pyrifoliae DSM 12163]
MAAPTKSSLAVVLNGKVRRAKKKINPTKMGPVRIPVYYDCNDRNGEI